MRSKTGVKLFAAATIALAATAPCLADIDLTPHSLWHENKRGMCLEIGEISKPLPGSDECVQISGAIRKARPVAGYACARQSTIGFFANIGESDNSIRPEFYVGTYRADAIKVQYCVRTSNDWPPEYNCNNEIELKRVNSCPP
jgi:hypothetical protein